MNARDYLLRQRVLPQRRPGAALAAITTPKPSHDGCHRCANGQQCEERWAREHTDGDECECCVGRYSRCRGDTA